MTDLLDKRLVFVTGKGRRRQVHRRPRARRSPRRAQGKRTIVCEVAAQEHTSRVFHRAEIGFHEVEMDENLWAISIDPDESMREYVLLQLKVKAMRDMLFRSRIFTYLAAATPGLKELVTIGKIWELAQLDRKVKGGRKYDLVIVDAPATGHGVGFLQTPRTFANIARVGPIRRRPRRSTTSSRDHEQDRRRDRRAARGDAGERDGDARAASSTDEIGVEVDRIYMNALYPERFDEPRGRAARREAGRAAATARAARRRAARRSARAAGRAAAARAARPARGDCRGPGDDAAVRLRAELGLDEIGALAEAVDLMAGVAELLEGKRVCICAGSGGVGKTTTSAAIAAGMAARGQEGRGADDRPGEAARRLARAARARQRRAPGRPGAVRGRGRRHRRRRAVGDDARREGRPSTSVVRKHAPDAETRDRILANRIYQQLSNALAGSQEYMAMEKLFEIHAEDRYDLLVLDTPPSRNALDFLDAPRRLTQFIEGRALQVFMRPTGIGMKVFGARHLDDVLGPAADHRASTCSRTCRSSSRRSAAWSAASASAPGGSTSCSPTPETSFLVVCGPQGEPIEEAVYFHRKLVEAELPFGGVIVNKVHYESEPPSADAELERRAGRARSATATSPAGWPTTSPTSASSPSATGATSPTSPPRCAARAVIQVPYLDDDVHDLAGLMEINRYLFASGSEGARRDRDRPGWASTARIGRSHRALDPVARPALPGVVGGRVSGVTRCAPATAVVGDLAHGPLGGLGPREEAGDALVVASRSARVCSISLRTGLAGRVARSSSGCGLLASSASSASSRRCWSDGSSRARAARGDFGPRPRSRRLERELDLRLARSGAISLVGSEPRSARARLVELGHPAPRRRRARPRARSLELDLDRLRLPLGRSRPAASAPPSPTARPSASRISSAVDAQVGAEVAAGGVPQDRAGELLELGRGLGRGRGRRRAPARRSTARARAPIARSTTAFTSARRSGSAHSAATRIARPRSRGSAALEQEPQREQVVVERLDARRCARGRPRSGRARAERPRQAGPVAGAAGERAAASAREKRDSSASSDSVSQ